MNFYINEQYLCSVSSKQEIKKVKEDNESDEDFLARILKTGSISFTAYSSTDHPEFTKLREELGELGYIYIERGWINGDRVLKPFTLNNYSFSEGDKFSCAAALNYTLTRT
jgi:hypothetical protein